MKIISIEDAKDREDVIKVVAYDNSLSMVHTQLSENPYANPPILFYINDYEFEKFLLMTTKQRMNLLIQFFGDGFGLAECGEGGEGGERCYKLTHKKSFNLAKIGTIFVHKIQEVSLDSVLKSHFWLEEGGKVYESENDYMLKEFYED